MQKWVILSIQDKLYKCVEKKQRENKNIGEKSERKKMKNAFIIKVFV